MSERKKTSLLSQLIPVMFAFFAMGFVDSIGTATNYVKESFNLSNRVASLCPSMVFFWFLVCSVPTGMLLNKIGRRKSVLISLAITVGALILPLIYYSFTSMMVVFALLGISNTIMQVSLNPLVANVVTKEKLASTMTFGQFIKAIASLVAPLLAAWFTARTGNWLWVYGVFAVEGVIALLLLGKTDIHEEPLQGPPSTFTQCLALLGNGAILLCFVGIVCHVGIDVGTNTSGPQLLMERLGWELKEAIFASGIYFMFRMSGCLAGSFLLAKFSPKVIFAVSVGLMLSAMGGLFLFHSKWPLYLCFALIGLGNANIFPVIFSQALMRVPHKQNEVSGLMIMGLIGGTVFPLLMGYAADALHSQSGSVLVMTCAVLYLCGLTLQIKKIS